MSVSPDAKTRRANSFQAVPVACRLSRRANQDHPFTWTVFYEMNHREPPHLLADTRKASHCLALLLLSAMAPHRAPALPRVAEPTPYLPAMGAPPLRFRPPFPPSDSALHLSAAAPKPAIAPHEALIDPAQTAAPQASPVSATEENHSTTASTDKPSDSNASTPARPPLPILPDTARPAIRPEDFLPYFQIPGSARHADDVTLLVPAPKAAPAPATIPPSSATYTQTPQ